MDESSCCKSNQESWLANTSLAKKHDVVIPERTASSLKRAWRIACIGRAVWALRNKGLTVSSLWSVFDWFFVQIRRVRGPRARTFWRGTIVEFQTLIWYVSARPSISESEWWRTITTLVLIFLASRLWQPGSICRRDYAIRFKQNTSLLREMLLENNCWRWTSSSKHWFLFVWENEKST